MSIRSLPRVGITVWRGSAKDRESVVEGEWTDLARAELASTR